MRYLRYPLLIVIIAVALWGAAFGVAGMWPRAGDLILLRTDARPAFYQAHPELSTEILFSGAGITLYRVLSED